MSERITTGDRRGWDLWLKAASLVCTGVVLPGAGWAVSVHQQLSDMDGRIRLLAAQLDSDRNGVSSLLLEVRELRRELSAMKTELVQRITRVETQLERAK